MPPLQPAGMVDEKRCRDGECCVMRQDQRGKSAAHQPGHILWTLPEHSARRRSESWCCSIAGGSAWRVGIEPSSQLRGGCVACLATMSLLSEVKYGRAR